MIVCVLPIGYREAELLDRLTACCQFSGAHDTWV